MPTSLPLVYSTDIARAESSHASDGVWFIAVWGIVMLTFAALTSFGTEVGAMDPFQLLATF